MSKTMNTNKISEISERIKSFSERIKLFWKSIFAAAIIATFSSCAKPVDKEVATSFYESLSQSNKEKYELLLQSTGGRLDDSVISDIVSACSWKDSLSAWILLESHVNTLLEWKPYWSNHIYALWTVNEIENALYPNLYNNPELLKFVYEKVWASDNDTKTRILREIAPQYDGNVM